MKKLKKEKSESNIGVAHNGILSLTSDGAKDYSDTMLFITEYLVNIIRSYDWYKDKRTVKLIENLIDGSRFAILDKTGHCQLMGRGWIEDNGVSYSNSTYSYKKQVYTSPAVYRGCGYGLWDDYYESDDKRWQDYGKKQQEVKVKQKRQQQHTVHEGTYTTSTLTNGIIIGTHEPECTTSLVCSAHTL
jgi:hypothetical protein